ncbi:MAG TPA: response regulator [Bacteroidia bacterium]|jgi:DNA-binding NtrC family response regulator|nr:response regulator [Bacteroidia bacterium]
MQPFKFFRIIVLEDNEFYNRLLTKQLKNYTDVISAQKNYGFEIQSYTNPADCLNNLKEDTDLAFVDFYLGNSVTGLELIKQIKEKSPNCKIVIISQVRSVKTAFHTLAEGALEYIFKDSNALARSCFILEDIINSSTNKNNWQLN